MYEGMQVCRVRVTGEIGVERELETKERDRGGWG